MKSNENIGLGRLWRWLIAFVSPVGRELGLFVTMLVTFNLRTFLNLNRYVIRGHVLPDWLPRFIVGSMGITVIVAYLVALTVSHISNKRRRRLVKRLIYTALLPLWFVTLFLHYNFNADYTPQVFTLLFETNGGEASEFLRAWLPSHGTRYALFLSVMTLAAVILIERYRKAIVDWCGDRRLVVALSALLLAALMACGCYVGSKLVRPYSSPTQFEIVSSELNSNDIISQWHTSAVMLYFARHETRHAIELNTKVLDEKGITCTRDTFTLVLVIGESYNKHHSSLYGYRLPTSPRLEAERDSGNLVVFADVVSPYNLTSASVKNMLSLNMISRGERWHNHPLWPALLRAAGYELTMWDNQRDYKAGSALTFSLNSLLYSPELANRLYTATNDSTFVYDGNLIDNFAGSNALHKGKLRCHIFHLMGQHTAYERRYPVQWRSFTAADVPLNAPYLDLRRRETIAHYDNATLYNDYVLSNILNFYRDNNAIVVMLSDHGEEVYDYRDFMERDHNPDKTPLMLRYENEVPFAIWFSPRAIVNTPELLQRVRAISSRPLMIDNIGPLMLTLAGVTSRYNCDESRNPLSNSYRPGLRLLYDSSVDYDLMTAE